MVFILRIKRKTKTFWKQVDFINEEKGALCE